jgi:uncharacterized membrane protein YsdA (DUF1294 family)
MDKTTRNHLVILAVIAIIAILFMIWMNVSWIMPVWWIIWGGVTFAYYGYDKRQAKTGGWRVPENILHLLAATGGFIGGWIGMFYFRHKTQKAIFKVVLALSTVGWLLLWYLLWR